MVAAASADVSQNLRKYLPPLETVQHVQAAPVVQLPINKYLPPVNQQAAPAPSKYSMQQYQYQHLVCTFCNHIVFSHPFPFISQSILMHQPQVIVHLPCFI